MPPLRTTAAWFREITEPTRLGKNLARKRYAESLDLFDNLDFFIEDAAEETAVYLPKMAGNQVFVILPVMSNNIAFVSRIACMMVVGF